MGGSNLEVNMIRLFYDIIGILNGMSMANIFVVFIKIAYRKIKDIIDSHAPKYLNNEEFMIALLKFYSIMCSNCLEKISRD